MTQPGDLDAADVDLEAFNTPGFEPDVVDDNPDPADAKDHDDEADA